MMSNHEDKYTAKEYLQGIILGIVVLGTIVTVGAFLNEKFNTDPTCADYAKYGLEGSDYCAED